MSRRALLHALLALPLAGFIHRQVFVSASAEAPAPPLPAREVETPVMALFREWYANDIESYDVDLPDEVCDAYVIEMNRIERLIEAEDARTPVDFIIKVIVSSSYGAFDLPYRRDDDGAAFWAEARALVGVTA